MSFIADAPLQDTEGSLLAHSLKIAGHSFKKGHELTRQDLEVLAAAGVTTLTVVRVDADELHENDAAGQIGQALKGGGVTVTEAHTGRCNLQAAHPGLLHYDPNLILDINLLDEALTVGTQTNNLLVDEGDEVATIKIIPFAIKESIISDAMDRIAREAQGLRVLPFDIKNCALLQTCFKSTKPALLDKTYQAMSDRLGKLGCPDLLEQRCAHAQQDIEKALAELAALHLDMIMIAGASATVDRGDTIPAAISAAGGQIDHFGLPVDPGNLLLLARFNGKPLIGLPGCARSHLPNGTDWVLERLAAGLTISQRDIAQMGVGGLLKETAARPLPRHEAVKARHHKAKVSILVLAAGSSHRMGEDNKLLAPLSGVPLLTQVVNTALEAQAYETIVVTGHAHQEVEELLSPYAMRLRFTHNPNHADGLSSSLQRGLAALSKETEACLVLLGDMPEVTAETLQALITSFSPRDAQTLCVPVYQGQSGNPLLFGRRYFNEIMKISGDRGARFLLKAYPDQVTEVTLDDPGVLEDIDTPQALKQAQERVS